MDYQNLITEIIRREGGDKYTNRPNDRGGPTKFGVTLATLSEWRGVKCTAQDVQNLTEREAREIYFHRYISQPKFDKIEHHVIREFVIDIGVNSGTGTAARTLQRAAGVKDDGVLGPITLSAVNKFDPKELLLRLVAERIVFLGRLITRAPNQAENAHGWMNRVAEFCRKDI